MEEQIIISISREYGAGGHHIADKLAEKYGLKVYASGVIKEIAEEKGLDINKLLQYDEKPKNRLFSRTINSHSNSPEDAVAQLEFDYLLEKAKKGESFIVVGRCSDYVLREFDCLVKVFVMADMPEKAARTAEYLNVSMKEAEEVVESNNRKRKAYHNFYAKKLWGDSRYYDILINTSKVGHDASAEIVDNYIQKFMEKRRNK